MSPLELSPDSSQPLLESHAAAVPDHADDRPPALSGITLRAMHDAATGTPGTTGTKRPRVGSPLVPPSPPCLRVADPEPSVASPPVVSSDPASIAAATATTSSYLAFEAAHSRGGISLAEKSAVILAVLAEAEHGLAEAALD